MYFTNLVQLHIIIRICYLTISDAYNNQRVVIILNIIFNLAYTEYQEMVKNFNTGNAIVSSTSLDSRIAANIKVDRKVLSRRVSLNSWSTLYKLGILLDPKGDYVEGQSNNYSYHINKNLIIEENQMVLVDITLDELNGFIEDKHVFKRFVRL